VLSGSAAGNPYVYHGGLGYWEEGAAGLKYVRARWLEAETGSWLSVDPVTSEPRYSYAHNMPTTGADPSGTQYGAVLPPKTAAQVQQGSRSWWEREGKHDLNALAGTFAAWNLARIPENFSIIAEALDMAVQQFLKQTEDWWREKVYQGHAALVAEQKNGRAGGVTALATVLAKLGPTAAAVVLPSGVEPVIRASFQHKLKNIAPPPADSPSIILFYGGLTWAIFEFAQSFFNVPQQIAAFFKIIGALGEADWGMLASSLPRFVQKQLGDVWTRISGDDLDSYERGKLLGTLLTGMISAVLAVVAVYAGATALKAWIGKVSGRGQVPLDSTAAATAKAVGANTASNVTERAGQPAPVNDPINAGIEEAVSKSPQAKAAVDGVKGPTRKRAPKARRPKGFKQPIAPAPDLKVLLEVDSPHGRVPILGRHQNAAAGASDRHAELILAEAVRLAKSGKYLYLVLDTSWGKATGQKLPAHGGKRPDIIGITRDPQNPTLPSKVDAWEYPSPSDLKDPDWFRTLRTRLDRGMAQLRAEIQGETNVLGGPESYPQEWRK
jgi:RHS repeat-associated protein